MKKRKLLFSAAFGLFLFFLVFSAYKSVEGGGGGVHAGIATCKACHQEYYNSYAGSIHAKRAIPGSPANVNQCESCHGPGLAHVAAGGGRVGIVSFDRKTDAKTKSAQCLSCHEESKHLAFWDMGKHKSAGVSCDDCHAVHSRADKNLKAKEPDLCYSCHRNIRAQASRQSRHPIKEGLVSCTDCHDPHGGFGPKMVKADTVNELCYKCHAEKRGPFMFEHAPVEENCLSCHVAHGSNHRKLLVRKTPQLCQSCHNLVGHQSTPFTQFDTWSGPAPSRFMVARDCLNCHTNIHGSNAPHTRGLRFVR